MNILFRICLLSVLTATLAMQPACTVMAGNRTKGTYVYASAGGDASDLAIGPEGAAARTINNSKSLGVVTKTIGTVAGTGIVTKGLTDGTRIIQGEGTKRIVSQEGTKRSLAAGKEATQQAKIAAEAAAAAESQALVLPPIPSP